MKELSDIQQKLKAPKNQRNKFGNYNYRSCEDILEAVKPLLGECTLTLSDEIVEVGGRVYVKSTAALLTPDGKVCEAYGYAREAAVKKGMDDSQITGSTSSYARKYALNGLFCIDDNKDADATNDHGKAPAKKAAKKAAKEKATKQQLENIKTLRSQLGTSDDVFKKQLESLGASKPEELTKESVLKLLTSYTKKLQS